VAALPLRRIVALLAIAAVVVVGVRAALVQTFVIPTGSMEPTLRVGERVLVSPAAATLRGMHRGDVVVFDGSGVFDPQPAPPSSALARAGRAVAAAAGAPVGTRDYVKRVIGLPGDRVACCDNVGRVVVNGRPLDEPYVHAGDAASLVRFSVAVPAGRIWVMGDHRSASADSRAHLGDPGGGTVPIGRVIGLVVAVSWPPSDIHVLGSGPTGGDR
jgi:signal peptidase I